MQLEIPRIDGLSEDQVRTLMNCRGLAQYKSMIEDYRAGKCPFCDPLSEKNVVVQENKSWRMWLNPFPLKHTSQHMIIAHQKHNNDFFNLEIDDWTNLGHIFLWAREEYFIPGGAFAMRIGTPKLNAGSVLHLHANIIVPDGSGPVQVTLAKEPKKVEETIQRMYAFEKLISGTSLEQLSDYEQQLVAGRLE